VIFYAGVALVVTLVVMLGWRAAASRDARRAAGTTTASYAFGASYALPWYANWSLPALTDATPSALAWVVWLQAAVALTALKMHDHPTGTIGDALFRGLFTDVFPVVLLVAFVVIGLRRSPQDRSGEPANQSESGIMHGVAS
jgi:hypothetical protein